MTLFDYGVGNLHSIRKALEAAGAEVTVTRDAGHLVQAPAIVLPGVGAFGACMEPLLEHRQALHDHLLAGTPCLAVCIGMQLLFASSEESPGVPGIGYLRGHVERFPSQTGKIPHMGWNTLHAPMELPRWDTRSGVGLGWQDLLPGADASVYYVHSYLVRPQDPITLRSTTYGNADNAVEFAAVVARGNTLATQFHPEKSSQMGLAIIDHWVDATARHLGQPTRQKLDTYRTPQQEPRTPPGANR